jgi:signal transduction histidine kinase
VSSERLTRQELGWLLAQEARGAAKALREGVIQLTQPDPQQAAPEVTQVEVTLSALDGAIDLLTELEARPSSKSRRGRLDLAALLYDIAPTARILMEPGAGTEVYGDENELRRMLHVLVTQNVPEVETVPIEVSVRRDADFVKVGVALGPDRSATAELERRWLTRMAQRMGGHVELESGYQTLSLPADGASAQREVDALRKELAQAQQLGEAYARELAAIFAAGSLPESAPPPSRGPESGAEKRLELLARLAGALERMLRPALEGLDLDAQTLAAGALPEASTLAASLARRAMVGNEALAELKRISSARLDALPEALDLGALGRDVVAMAENRAVRHGVNVEAELPTSTSVLAPRDLVALLLRSLVDHAIAATPFGGRVRVSALVSGGVVRIGVEDGGPTVPAGASGEWLGHRLDPTSIGRPGGLSLLVAETVAARLNSPLLAGESSNGLNELSFSWKLLG